MRTPHSTQTDILFISEQPLWPMDQGYRVHGCQMSRALAGQGLNIAMSSLRKTDNCDAPWLNTMLTDWPTASEQDHADFMRGWAGPLSGLRKKIASHQALNTRELAGLVPLVKQVNPKVVIALGQHGPVMLRGLRAAFPGLPCVWYAADEPVFFQLSCLRREGLVGLNKRLYLATLYTLLHKLFARKLDGAIGVSETDTRLLKLMAGVRKAVNIPNGVDTHYFTPSNTRPQSCSLIFWGRLDFEPNADAVRWFARRVWPRLRERQPQSRWKIVGKNAGEQVRALGELPGIEFVGEVDDIREHARRAAVTILPMRCGGGIKNKLLEAASMGLPILASAKAVKGLSWPGHVTPVKVCKSPDGWVHQIERVWYDGILNAQLRNDAHAWVNQQHTWPGAAEKLTAFLSTITKEHLGQRPDIAGSIGPDTQKTRHAA